jgi:DNA mismatch repair protein MSH6
MQPHAGFPEVRYHEMAEALARAGYRVVVVEQTETPDMLAKRNEARKKAGQKMCNVVAREKVAVLSKVRCLEGAGPIKWLCIPAPVITTTTTAHQALINHT